MIEAIMCIIILVLFVWLIHIDMLIRKVDRIRERYTLEEKENTLTQRMK